MTRGLNNNNPGNIRWGEPWQGLVPDDQRTDTSFCQFIASEWGIRAIAKILMSYKSLGIMTIHDAISRWAPTNENDTDAYILDVSQRCAIDPEACINLTDFTTCKNIIKAIIYHENGSQPYTDDLISKGLSLAGILP